MFNKFGRFFALIAVLVPFLQLANLALALNVSPSGPYNADSALEISSVPVTTARAVGVDAGVSVTDDSVPVLCGVRVEVRVKVEVLVGVAVTGAGVAMGLAVAVSTTVAKVAVGGTAEGVGNAGAQLQMAQRQTISSS